MEIKPQRIVGTNHNKFKVSPIVIAKNKLKAKDKDATIQRCANGEFHIYYKYEKYLHCVFDRRKNEFVLK